jgi:tetratricopeptide (TPR) repeat protein
MSFASDAELVSRDCDALIRAAERTPPDEPQPADSPALLAERAARTCLERAADLPAELAAFLHMARGNALRLLGRHDDALAEMQRAIALAPERGGFFQNLAILHKARRSFAEGLAAAERAHAALGDRPAVLWNVAICATAVGDGARAAQALEALGHAAEVADSGMPFVDGLPPVQVRVATLGAGYGDSRVPEQAVGFEALWVTPISPCHGVVSSPSFRSASVDYGDVVLWDAIPVGAVVHEGHRVVRLPLLAVLKRGDERRLRFVALQQQAREIAALARDMPAGGTLFVHEERIEQLCARCASGEHMQKHAHEPPEEHRLAYGKLVIDAARDLGEFRTGLEAAQRRHPGVRLIVPELHELLGETEAAGKAHTLWRSLERSVGPRS